MAPKDKRAMEEDESLDGSVVVDDTAVAVLRILVALPTRSVFVFAVDSGSVGLAVGSGTVGLAVGSGSVGFLVGFKVGLVDGGLGLAAIIASNSSKLASQFARLISRVLPAYRPICAHSKAHKNQCTPWGKAGVVQLIDRDFLARLYGGPRAKREGRGHYVHVCHKYHIPKHLRQSFSH